MGGDKDKDYTGPMLVGAGLHAFMSVCSHSTVGGLRDRFRNNRAMVNCSYLISDKLAKVDSVGKTKQIPL